MYLIYNAYQVRVTVGDSGLRCICVASTQVVQVVHHVRLSDRESTCPPKPWFVVEALHSRNVVQLLLGFCLRVGFLTGT